MYLIHFFRSSYRLSSGRRVSRDLDLRDYFLFFSCRLQRTFDAIYLIVPRVMFQFREV